jgi:hypothetical protein
MDPIKIVVFVIVALVVLIFLLGIRIVRPTHRGLMRGSAGTNNLPDRVFIGSSHLLIE